MKKNVLLGITGSISAYKSTELVRLLKKNGFNVKCVLTEAGAQFITKTTLQTLSQNNVYEKTFSDDFEEEHISLAKWSDIIVVAPATCDIISRAAQGRCSDLLSSVIISFIGKVIFCPAMNANMWRHPATANNVKKLISYGYTVIPPEKGELACGDLDIGRLAEPTTILNHIKKLLK